MSSLLATFKEKLIDAAAAAVVATITITTTTTQTSKSFYWQGVSPTYYWAWLADWQRLSENGLGKRHSHRHRQRRRRRQIKRQMRKLWIRTA